MNREPLQLLIVDDEGAHVEAIRRAFDTADLKTEIRIAGTLQGYWECIATRPPDLVLIDLNLPDGSAIDVLTAPAEDGRFPILVMTAFGNQQTVVEVLKAGALDYVVKSAAAFSVIPRTVEKALREWTLLQERRRTQQLLRESEEKFRQLADNITDVFWIAAPDLSMIHYISPGYELIWGRPVESLYADLHQWVNSIVPEDRERIFGIFSALADNGPEVSVEYRIARPDGTIRWIHDHGFQVKDNAGKVIRTTGIAKDITKRKEAEVELQETKAILQAAMDNSQNGIAIVDAPNGILRYVNRAGLLILGDFEEQLQPGIDFVKYASTWHLLNSDGTAFRFKDGAVAKAIEYGEKSSREFIVRRKGLADRNVWIDAAPIFDSEGGIKAGIAIFHDITERKLAEKEVRQLSSIVQSSPDFTGIASLEGQVLFINAEGRKMLGMEEAEKVESSMMLEYVHETDRQRFQNEVLPALFRDGRWDGETIFKNLKTGEPINMWQRIFFITEQETNRRVSIATTARDITERKQAEARHRLQSSALEAAANAIVITDERGTIEWTNAAFTTLTGYSVAEAIGQNPRILKSGQHDPSLYEALWKTILSGEVWRGELINRRKDGTFYTEEMTITPVKDGNGGITHFIAVKQDISVRKQVEIVKKDILHQKKIAQDWRGAKEAAETANRAKSAFLANMSHEIRTPMNAILGFSQLMLGDRSLRPEQKHRLEIINRSGDQLLVLINDVLDMSKIEAGRTTLKLARFDIRTMLSNLEEMFRVRVDEKALKFTVESMGDLPRYLIGDENKLHRVLVNLIGNAIKFTDFGSVVLRVWVIRLSDPENWRLHAEVEDTGVGIAEGEIELVFQTLEQSQSGGTSRGGTGLGLAISRALTRLMGGDITVQSRVGRGSIFQFDVPVKKVEETALSCKNNALPDPSYLRSRSPRVRILIADDRADNRLLLSEILEPEGFEICEAADGTEAVEKFETWQPHLILMDARMPKLSGHESIRRIRAAAGGAEVKIIVVTASVFDNDRRDAMAN